jgi:hypothetical protein
VTFDRTSLLVAAGWKEITARMENGRQLGHNFPQPRQFRVLGRVCQPRERHVWTIDETTDLTKCALSLPREIYTVWMWRCGSILMRCLDGRARSFSTRPLKVYSSSSAAVLPSARARSPGQSHLGRARPAPDPCKSGVVASIVSRVRGRAPKLRLHSPPQAASSPSPPSFARPLGLLRFSLQQIKLLLTLSWGEACYPGLPSLLRN